VVSDRIIGFIPFGGRLAHYENGPGKGRHAGYSYRAVFLAVHAGFRVFRSCGADVKVLWELCRSFVIILSLT
jgi:hypothetical protein